MKILCLGGGPAGLYFAISMKLRDPSHQVTVLERNKANDTFGWGVVLSDDALSRMQKNDPVSTDAIRSNFAYWDDIATIHNGVRTVSGGHGFAGIGRKATFQQRAPFVMDLRNLTFLCGADTVQCRHHRAITRHGAKMQEIRSTGMTIEERQQF